VVAGAGRKGAGREYWVGRGVRLSRGGDPTAGGFDRFEGGFGPEHREDTKGREDAALVGTVGMDVDEERRSTRSRPGGRYGGHDCGDATGGIPVPVRQEEHVARREIDAEAFRVGEPHAAVGADVE